MAEATATILNFRMGYSRTYNKPSSFAAVDYKLTLNGKEVRRTQIDSYVAFKTKEGLARKYKVGSVMKLCYNPENIEDPRPVLIESNESCQILSCLSCFWSH